MAFEFRLVEGVAYVGEASRLLSAAWRAPALHYSPEYLGWQLSFPGPGSAPAAAAFEGGQCVGFAASIHRRLRHGTALVDSLMVSFVAVHPGVRNQGVAAGLYDLLLHAVGDQGVPVVTFAIDGSPGERAILSAYPRAGFELRSLGEYPVFACMAAKCSENQGWSAVPASEAPFLLRTAIDACAASEDQLWSDPSDAQIQHYLCDPRGRNLLIRRTPGGPISAAWALPVEFVSATGVQSVLTIESVWTPKSVPAGLRGLGGAVALLWPSSPSVVNAPNLFGFDPAIVRHAGFRQIGARFRGYMANLQGSTDFEGATSSNIEII